MEQFENHAIKFEDSDPQKFQPAEGISGDGTKVELDNGNSTLQQRASALKPPWAAAEPTPAQVNWTLEHRQKVEEMRVDPGYQFYHEGVSICKPWHAFDDDGAGRRRTQGRDTGAVE